MPGEEGVVERRRRRRAKKEDRNINVRAAFIHVIGDLIQSVGVVIAGYVIWFGKHYAVSIPSCVLCCTGSLVPRPATFSVEPGNEATVVHPDSKYNNGIAPAFNSSTEQSA